HLDAPTAQLPTLDVALLVAEGVLHPRVAPATFLQLVEGWLGQVQEAPVDDRLHVPPEEGEQQGADVRPIHVGIGHEHDAVVTQAVDAEVLAEPHPQRRDQVLDLLFAEDLVGTSLLNVEDLATQRKDRLVLALTSLLRRPARAVSLDDEDLALRRVLLGAVGELAGKRRALEE